MKAKDKDAQLRNLIAGYGVSLRLNDIKALIALLFVAIMMLTVLQYRERYPGYLSAPVILTPFMIRFKDRDASGGEPRSGFRLDVDASFEIGPGVEANSARPRRCRSSASMEANGGQVFPPLWRTLPWGDRD